jgi:MGT family glycosyltransferase
MVPRVQAAEFPAIEVTQAYAQVDRYPAGTPITNAACYLTSPAVTEELASIVAQQSPDMLLVDCMFPAAHIVAHEFSGPKAVFCHTFLFHLIDMWRNTIAHWNGMREKAGFSTLPGADELWRPYDRMIVTTLAEYDTPVIDGWDNVRHAGPVLEDERCAITVQLPWKANDKRPLVLASFSTAFEQRSVDKVQRTLDALAPLNVRVVATTAGLVKSEELEIPANAVVFPYAQHDAIMKHASLVVMHGGHGTAMRSLKNGVPTIVMPGLAGDQAPIARTMEEWGAGIALPGDASVEAIRSAAERIFSDSSYAQTAQRLSLPFAGVDGAANAADELESLLGVAAAR